MEVCIITLLLHFEEISQDNMKKYYQKQKHLQELTYLRRKQYKNPYRKIQGKTKRETKYIKQLINFFKLEANSKDAYPEEQRDEVMDKDYYNHVKILNHVGLRRIRPPYWFRNIAFNYLLRMFEKWKAQATQLNQDYYLKLWIYDDEFSRSEIVFGLNNRVKRYNNLFENHDQEKDMTFLTKVMKNKLMNYNIQYCKEMIPLRADDFEEDKTCQVAEYAIKMGYDIDKNLLLQEESILKNLDPFLECGFIQKIDDEDSDEHFYIMHIDNIWVLE